MHNVMEYHYIDIVRACTFGILFSFSIAVDWAILFHSLTEPASKLIH